MKRSLKKALNFFLRPLIDGLLSIAIIPAAYLLMLFRRLGAGRLPWTRDLLKSIGVFPIRDHYYDPLFNDKHLLRQLNEDRDLPGLNLNVNGQIDLLTKLTYSNELRSLKLEKPAQSPLDFSILNRAFGSGDAES